MSKMLSKELQELAVKDVIPTLDNPRHIDVKDPDFQELVRSVKDVGVLIPVHVRPHPKKQDKWDLRCGGRRLQAVLLAKRQTIPAIVHRAMTDDAAFELTFMENFSREDLSALEQGAAVAILLERYKGDFRAVAGKLGWSETAVWRRARLTKLTPDWQGELAHPKSMFKNWTAGHMELIARYEPEQQDAWLAKWRKEAGKYGYNAHDNETVHGLEQTLASDMRLLSKARWKLDDGQLVRKAGSCADCTKRSSCKPGLFEDGAVEPLSKDDKCVDAGCWQKKERAWLKRRKQELREKHGENLVEISTGYGGGKNTLSSWQYDKAKKGDKGAVPAVVVNGPGTGSVKYIKIRKDAGGSSGGMSGKPLMLKQLRHGLQVNRERALSNIIEEQLEPAGKKAGDRPLRDVMCLVITLGATPPYGKDKLSLKQLMKLSDDKLRRLLWCCMAEHVDEMYWPSFDEPELICKLAGIDYKAIVKKVKQELPEPPEWKDLKADGTPKKKPAKKKAKGNEDILEGDLVKLASCVSARIGQDEDGWWYRLRLTLLDRDVVAPTSSERYDTRHEAEFDATKVAIELVRNDDEVDGPTTNTLMTELKAHLKDMNGNGRLGRKAGQKAAKQTVVPPGPRPKEAEGTPKEFPANKKGKGKKT